MSLYTRVLLLCFFSCLSFAAAAQSVTDGVLINADNMDRDMVKGLVHLSGNVQVVFKGQHLSCDRADLNQKQQTITAIGHVILSNERVHVEGDHIIFNYKQNTGFIYNGFVQSGQVVFEGDVIEKVGESHYTASNAEYTACDTCPPGWSFSGRNIDAEIGGYARIKRPVFKVGGWPILILPSLIVPLKSSRQSGFLAPTYDHTTEGGSAPGESYFWAINRSQDLTTTFRAYELRGYKLMGDYRYVLSDSSKGELQSAWLKDRAVRGDIFRRTKAMDRWFVDYTHYYEMPEQFVHRADVAQASDLRYPRDFTDEIKGWGDPALQTKTSITKSTDDNYASVEAEVYTNLLKQYPTAPNDDSVHRLPEIRYSYKEHQLFDNGPYVAMDLDYVDFSRGSHNYDDLQVGANPRGTGTIRQGTYGTPSKENRGVGPNGEIRYDGSFDCDPGTTGLCKTDLNRTGQRLDARPTLSYPFQIARRFDVLPSVTYRETQYRFNVDTREFSPTAARRYVQTDLKVKTELNHIFGDLNDPKSTRYKHSIEPEIGYSQIPWLRTPNHPFFGNFKGLKYSRQYDPLGDADLNDPLSLTGVQFDYEDRTYQRQSVDLALTNRLTRKTFKNGEPDYYTVGLFRLSQSYDIHEANSGEFENSKQPHPWSPITALLNVRLDRFETYTTAVYNPYAKVTNTSARVRFMTTPKDFLQISYARNFILDTNDTVEQGTETRNIGFGGGINSRYFEVAGEINYSDLTNKVSSWGYVMKLRPPGRCWVITITHSQTLGGDRKINISPSFDFGGDNKKGIFD
jgi:LPS-assembly protein